MEIRCLSRRCGDNLDNGLREVVIGNYLVFYRVEKDGILILILRVLHGKRDLAAEDFEE